MSCCRTSESGQGFEPRNWSLKTYPLDHDTSTSSNLCDEGFLSPHRVPMNLPLLTHKETWLGVVAELSRVDGDRGIVFMA